MQIFIYHLCESLASPEHLLPFAMINFALLPNLATSSGAAEPGGSGGVGPPLEFEIYLVNFLKNRKKKGFFSIGPPLGKNRSSAPVYVHIAYYYMTAFFRFLTNAQYVVLKYELNQQSACKLIE